MVHISKTQDMHQKCPYTSPFMHDPWKPEFKKSYYVFLSVFRHKNNNWFCSVLKYQIFKELWPVHSGGQHAPATLAEEGQNERKEVKNVNLLGLQHCKYILCYIIWFLDF